MYVVPDRVVRCLACCRFYPCNNGRVPISLWCGPRGKDSSAPDVASSVLSGYTSKLRFYFGDTGSNTAYAPIPDFELPQYQVCGDSLLHFV